MKLSSHESKLVETLTSYITEPRTKKEIIGHTGAGWSSIERALRHVNVWRVGKCYEPRVPTADTSDWFTPGGGKAYGVV